MNSPVDGADSYKGLVSSKARHNRRLAESRRRSHLAQANRVKGEVSWLAVLLIHVDDGREEQNLGEGNPEKELPHGALLHL